MVPVPAALGVAAALLAGAPAGAGVVEGRVTTGGGEPVAGARVSLGSGEPLHEVTVFTDADGAYRSPELAPGAYTIQIRRIGFRDRVIGERVGPETSPEEPQVPQGPALRLDVTLARQTDPAAVAAQLPANRWFALLLDRVQDDAQREELVRQCTFCHQQGNEATRRLRDVEQWDKLLDLMARMGGVVSSELRARIPELFNAAYDPETAVPALTADMHAPGFAPPPPPRVRRAVIEEWELGHRASMQHDLVVHPDGRIYSVDMTQDKLYRLDPRDGSRAAFDVPRGDLPLGGVFGGGTNPAPPNANAHVGPHSLQVAPDGAIWTTLALGNQLARFDPDTEQWETYPLDDGLYPHTLRFDAKGRIWYSVAVSNHLGMYDPATGEHRQIRLPAGSIGQAVVLRLLPAFLWLNRHLDLASSGAGEGISMPVPYGVDVAPDGDVWFSQLNEHRIGRVDPETLEVEMIETPFSAPRRLRFDERGRLWIPGFSSGVLSRFDPETREFDSYPLPVEPAGSDTPYALNVHPQTGDVWICGTNSDTLIQFNPEEERFTVYPLPTRVTYTREIDFDTAGRVWTSNSNLPTWQIEGGFPRVLRLDPDPPDAGGARQVAGTGR